MTDEIVDPLLEAAAGQAVIEERELTWEEQLAIMRPGRRREIPATSPATNSPPKSSKSEATS